MRLCRDIICLYGEMTVVYTLQYSVSDSRTSNTFCFVPDSAGIWSSYICSGSKFRSPTCVLYCSAKCQDVFLLTALVCAKSKFCYLKIQGSWSIIVLNWMKVLYGSLPKMLNMNIELYMFNVYSKLKKQICIWHCQLYGSNSALIPTGFKETSFEKLKLLMLHPFSGILHNDVMLLRGDIL